MPGLILDPLLFSSSIEETDSQVWLARKSKNIFKDEKSLSTTLPGCTMYMLISIVSLITFFFSDAKQYCSLSLGKR